MYGIHRAASEPDSAEKTLVVALLRRKNMRKKAQLLRSLLALLCLGVGLVAWSYAEDPKLRDVRWGLRAKLWGQTKSITSLAFSPDGKTLASGSYDRTILLWDVATSKNTAALKGHTGVVSSLSFSPDGKALASAGATDQTIKLWDMATRKNTATFKGHTDTIFSVVFSPKGKILASGSYDQTIKLWDVATGKNTATFKGHSGAVACVAFSPDGKTLATTSCEYHAKTKKLTGELKLWNVATGKLTTDLKVHSACIECVTFSPDGKMLATAGQFDIGFWEVAKDKNTFFILRNRDASEAFSVAFSPDSKTLASAGDAGVMFWDVATRKKRLKRPLVGDTGVNSPVIFSPNGKILAAGSVKGWVKLWDVDTSR